MLSAKHKPLITVAPDGFLKRIQSAFVCVRRRLIIMGKLKPGKPGQSLKTRIRLRSLRLSKVSPELPLSPELPELPELRSI